MRFWHIYIVCTLAMLFALGNAGQAAAQQNQATAVMDETLNFTVILERIYVDGEVSEETVMEEAVSLEEFWRKYEGWELVRSNGSRLILKQYVEDISPLLKANGYFGITDDGVLTIFNGRPDEQNIIHSFFQIDLGKLESSKKIELQNGIQVKSKDEFEAVLETFKCISTEKFQ